MGGMIASWHMAMEGNEKGCELFKTNQSAKDAIELAIKAVEDNPYYKSVGYGGLPNNEKIVELDAAFMVGESLSFGAVGAVQSIKNPITLARLLSKEKVNNFLVGEGALKYALNHGLKTQNMLSDSAEIHYDNRIK